MRIVCVFILLLLLSTVAEARGKRVSFSPADPVQVTVSARIHSTVSNCTPDAPVHFEILQKRRLWVHTTHDVVISEACRAAVARAFAKMVCQKVSTQIGETNRLDQIYPFHNFW